MRAGVAIFVCAGLAATCAGSEPPPGAPLEGAKEELKKLQADQTTKSGPASRLTDGLPRIQAPVPGAVQPEVPTAEKSAKESKRKAEARKNWLLDGVDQLEKKPARKGPERSRSGAEEEISDDEAGGSEPDDLLQLYTERKKADEAKAGERKTTPGRTDPLSPFLQDWMQTSPTRGKFFDEFVRKGDSTAGFADAGPGPIETGQGAAPAGLGDGTRSVGSVPQPNPYLEGLKPPAPPIGQGPSPRQPIADAVAPVRTGSKPAGEGMLEPVPASRLPEKKPPLLAPLDDKKYFPQLKKF